MEYKMTWENRIGCASWFITFGIFIYVLICVVKPQENYTIPIPGPNSGEMMECFSRPNHARDDEHVKVRYFACVSDKESCTGTVYENKDGEPVWGSLVTFWEGAERKLNAAPLEDRLCEKLRQKIVAMFPKPQPMDTEDMAEAVTRSMRLRHSLK